VVLVMGDRQVIVKELWEEAETVGDNTMPHYVCICTLNMMTSTIKPQIVTVKCVCS